MITRVFYIGDDLLVKLFQARGLGGWNLEMTLEMPLELETVIYYNI